MLMYLLMFLAVLTLRLKAPEHPRAFRIPGGFWGLLLVVIIGLIGILTTLVISFMPPLGINVGGFARYESMLITGLLLMCSPPFISHWLQHRRRLSGLKSGPVQ